jgi:hypothetical protein
MAHVDGLDARVAVELFLKRENHKHPPRERRDVVDTSPAPCPHLRADEIDDGDVGCAGPDLASEAEVEVGKIHQHYAVGPPRGHRVGHLLKNPSIERKPSDGLRESHDAHVARMANYFEALRGALVARNAEGAHVGAHFPNGPQKARRVRVPGGLAR